MASRTSRNFLIGPVGRYIRIGIDARGYNDPVIRGRERVPIVPDYLSDSEYENREFPYSISAYLVDYNPMIQPSQALLLEAIITMLRNALIDRLRILSPLWNDMTTAEILDRIRVRATITTPEMNEAISNTYDSASTQLTVQTFSTLWEKVIQSNDRYVITDMNFGIIINQGGCNLIY